VQPFGGRRTGIPDRPVLSDHLGTAADFRLAELACLETANEHWLLLFLFQADYHFASRTPRFQILDRRWRLTQAVLSVNDRRQFAGLH
jgi:hypothetical protein